MKKYNKIRTTYSSVAIDGLRKSSTFSENYEKSRNLYFSTLVLIARDKIEEMEQIAKSRTTDVFWSQLETMLTRHSAQMDRVSQQAVELRSNLSSSRKSKGTTHSDKINRANKKLKILQKQIKDQKSKVLMVENRVQEKEEAEVQSKIESANMEIEQFNFRIQNLRRTTGDLKDQIEKMRIENDSGAITMEQRRKDADVKAHQVSIQLEDTIKQINKTDIELRNLEERSRICTALFESLKQPLPSIQRIFAHK